MGEYHDALPVDAIDEGQMTRVDIDGRGILLARVGDRFYATDSRCPHLKANLTKGTLEGTVLICPLHGSRFDITDGSVLQWTDFHGAVAAVAEKVRHPRPLNVYEVRVEEGRVLVGPRKTSAV